MKQKKSECRLENGVLLIGGDAALERMSAEVSIEEDPTGTGVFLGHPANPHRGGWTLTSLGVISGMRRFTALRQRDPFWLVPLSGDALPEERCVCPFVLAECEDGFFTVLAAVPSDGLQHGLLLSDGGIRLVAENGDLSLPVAAGSGVFAARGRDLGALLDDAAHAIHRRRPCARLRRNKRTPAFADMLGWCTWNAFYHSVSAEKVEEGLRAFRSAGVRPRFMILDDGWQETADAPLSSRYLSGVKANAKFPGGLAPLVEKAKKEYGIEKFFVWHAAYGMPCGLHPGSAETAKYNARGATPPPSPLAVPDTFLDWTDGTVLNIPGKFGLKRYYKDQHDYLREEGVDGVKIDYQGVAAFAGSLYQGGSQTAIDSMRDVAEASCRVHFGDEWISCMSCLPSILYHSRRCNMTRGSDDFFPNQPARHGPHIRANAITALWFGHFTGIDWDMFQSADRFGLYHAAARAVSGGPVYVADAPDAIRADVLRRVAYPDGSVPRYANPGLPTRRSVFWTEGDGRRAPDGFAVSNGCFIPRQGGAVAAGTIAVFDLMTGSDPFPGGGARAAVEARDVPFMNASRCAVWKHNARELVFAKRGEEVNVRTGDERFEVLTVAPMLRDSYAILGIVSMFAAPLTVKEIAEVPGALEISLACGGEFAAALIDPPSAVTLGGAKIPFEYDEENCLLLARLPDDRGALKLTVKF